MSHDTAKYERFMSSILWMRYVKWGYEIPNDQMRHAAWYCAWVMSLNIEIWMSHCAQGRRREDFLMSCLHVKLSRIFLYKDISIHIDTAHLSVQDSGVDRKNTCVHNYNMCIHQHTLQGMCVHIYIHMYICTSMYMHMLTYVYMHIHANSI